jgi:hypothetical protein
MGYKYAMNPTSQRFTISSFLTFLAYIFSKSICLKYHCILSLYKVNAFTIGEFHVHQRGTLTGTTTTDHLTYYAPPVITITIILM